MITGQTGTQTDALGRTIPLGTILDPATTRPVTLRVADPVSGSVAASTGFVRDPSLEHQLRTASTASIYVSPAAP